MARSLRHLLRFLFLRLLSLSLLLVYLPKPPKRFLSIVVIRELFLTFLFRRYSLRQTTVHLSPSTSVHLWVPARRRRHRRPKPALVLVHGFGGNSKWQWVKQIGPLSRAFDLYVPDLLFFGRSQSGETDRSVAFQARCVAAAMHRLGIDRYSLVGISYGAFVAYRMAAADEAVERLAILTGGVGATVEQRRELVRREDRDAFDILLPQKADDLLELLHRSMHRPPWMPTFLLNDFIEVMYKDQRKERLELLNELVENGVGIDPLPVLKQETLILWGDKDKVFPLDLAHQLERHLGEKSRLEVVKDAGHALQLEKHNEVNHILVKFFSGDRRANY